MVDSQLFQAFRDSVQPGTLQCPQQGMAAAFSEALVQNENPVEVLDAISHDLGFDYYSCVFGYRSGDQMAAVQSSITVVSNYPSDWQKRYSERHYTDCDPIIDYTRTAYQPFLWGRECDIASMQMRYRSVMNESAGFGIRMGISVPSHGPGGSFALLSMITSSYEDRLSSLTQKHLQLLWMISPMVYAAMRRSYLPAEATGNVELTHSERTCLSWTAQGKTSWEISIIMDRSKPTVEYHLQKAMRKLNASTKAQAAIAAISLGLI